MALLVERKAEPGRRVRFSRDEAGENLVDRYIPANSDSFGNTPEIKTKKWQG